MSTTITRALLSRQSGPPESLELATLPTPRPGPGQVRLRVEAVALNFFDTLIIEDRYQVKPPRPFAPGGECVGIVEALGEGVTAPALGTRVLVWLGHGALSTHVLAEASSLAPVPQGLSPEIACTLPIAYGTTLHACRDRARLLAGETVAVLGASGGAGLAAVEMARAMGARVLACASSPEKLALAEAKGADVLIDYSAGDLKAQLRAATNDEGPHVIYDAVGGDHAEPALRSLRWEGRYLVIGFASGTIPRLPLNIIMLKNLSVLGAHWGAWNARNPEGHRANMEVLLDWAQAGTIRPHVERVVPLEEAARAIRALADREVKGKIVVRP